MNGAVKITLQVIFLVALIYALAAVVGAAPGVSVRGPGFKARLGRSGKRRRGRYGRRRSRRNEWVASGMYGEVAQTPGSALPMAGVSMISR